MFNRTTNNINDINTNTRIYSSYADDSLLVVSGWNENLSLKFHPCTGRNENNMRQYDRENTNSPNFTIRPQNALILIDAIDTSIIPAIKEGKEADVSIYTVSNKGEKKVLTINCKGNEVSLTLHTKINADNSADLSGTITHKFNLSSSMTGYDPATGNTNEVVYPSEFMMFVEKVRNVNKLDTMIEHGIKHTRAIKSAYANSMSQSSSTDSYQAPTTTFDGTDSGDFLPFN